MATWGGKMLFKKSVRIEQKSKCSVQQYACTKVQTRRRTPRRRVEEQLSSEAELDSVPEGQLASMVEVWLDPKVPRAVLNQKAPGWRASGSKNATLRMAKTWDLL